MSRQDVIREIVERDRQKLGLTEEIVMKEARVLYGTACQHFGTWGTALRYAGVDTRRLAARHGYSKDRVIRTLRKRCTTGYSLSAKRNMRRESRLYRAALRHFGTWRQALEAAGIDARYAHLVSKPRRLDRKKILEALRQRYQAGRTLVWRVVCLENRAFATAVKNAFGSWRKALIAAGIPPEVGRATDEGWDKQRVVAEIRERQRQNKPLTCRGVGRDHAALLSAAKRHFGQWTTALEVAGIVLGKRVETDEGACVLSVSQPRTESRLP